MKNSHIPLVSVIIITYQRHQDVIELLDNLCDQSFHHFEIILVDNDHSSHLKTLLRGTWPFVLKYKNMSENLGVAGGRNAGIQMACGEYLVFIDDDALFSMDDALDQVVNLFKMHSDMGCIAFRIQNYYTGQTNRGEFPYPDVNYVNQEMLVGYFIGAGHAIKKEVLDKAGIYQDDFMYGFEELDLSYRIVNAGYSILYAPNIIVQHKNSPSGRFSAGNIVRYYIRNRIRVVVSYLPYKYWPSHLLVWSLYFLWRSLQCRALKNWFLGIRDAVRYLPSMSRENKLSMEAETYMKRAKGRLWY